MNKINKSGSLKASFLVAIFVVAVVIGFYIVEAADVIETVDPNVTKYDEGIYKQFNFTIENNGSVNDIEAVNISSEDYTLLNCSGAVFPAGWNPSQCIFFASNSNYYVGNGSSENFIIPALTPNVTGTYNWTIGVRRNGTWSSSIIQTSVDTDKPVVAITMPINHWQSEGLFSVNGTFSGDDLDYCEYFIIDNGSISNSTELNCGEAFNFNVSIANVSANCSTQGNNTCIVRIRANDTVGNINEIDNAVGVDWEAPAVTFELDDYMNSCAIFTIDYTYFDNMGINAAENVVFNVTNTDTNDSDLRYDNAPDNTINLNLCGMGDGNYSIFAKAEDLAGNIGLVSVTENTTLDSVPPEFLAFDFEYISVPTPANIYSPATNIAWTESVFDLTINVTDNGAGIDYCEVYYDWFNVSEGFLTPELLFVFSENDTYPVDLSGIIESNAGMILLLANDTYAEEYLYDFPPSLWATCYDLAGSSTEVYNISSYIDFSEDGVDDEDEAFDILGFENDYPSLILGNLNGTYYKSSNSDGIHFSLCDASGINISATSLMIDDNEMNIGDSEVYFDETNRLCYNITLADSNITTTIKDWELETADFFSRTTTESGELDVRSEVVANLSEGWNLISSPLRLNDNNISIVFSDLDNVTVLTRDAENEVDITYTKSNGIGGGNLDTFEDGKGYWVHVAEDSSLILRGLDPRYVEGGSNITSYELFGNAWNLIGVSGLYENNTILLDNYLASVAGNYNSVTVQTWDGERYVSEFEEGHRVIKTVQGYWIYMDAEAWLTIPGIGV